uniref:DUF3592 domain-containing protein n=1 Tax=Hymenobacter cellulosivorans TaxID=2932249 RepID=UPI0035CBE4F6
MCIVLLLVFLYVQKQEKPSLKPPNRISVLWQGISVEGTIVGVETEGLRFFDEFPIVRFRTPQGQWLTLTCLESTKGPGFKKGQKVEVRFLPDFPKHFIVVSGFDFLLQ